jgi:lipopolysaccharide transport system permease protein
VLRYRYLFEQMVRRELRQRYKGSVLGVLWYLINPLVLMGAYGLMFGVLLKAVTIEDYLLFLFVGLIVWIFFQQSLLSAAPSLLDQAALVRKVRFPRETIPASVVTVQLVTFGVLLVLVTPVAVAVRGPLGPELLLLVPVVLFLVAFVAGLALVVAILHAHFRDVAPIVAAVLLPWFFLTPIFFRVEDLPGLKDHEWAEVLLQWVNPVAPFIEAFRDILYSGVAPDAATFLYIAVAGLLALAGGVALFRRMDAELAVVV